MQFTPDDHPFSRLFTPAEANAALPLVKAIVSDLAELTRDVVERRQRLEVLSAGREDKEPTDPYAEEMVEFKRELEQDTERLGELVEELREIGVEPKNASMGLVDFPCELDGRIVLLCWKLDEAEVRFWHELDAGFAGRQPVQGTFQSREKSGTIG